MRDLYGQFGKRLFELGAAMAVLAILSPLFLLIAVFVKIRSPGPALFSQQRIGRAGKPFRIWKFRTMHVRTVCSTESSVSILNDPRIFPGGRWLRKFKFDELPQLWNVVLGNMSLVGPRPTVAEDYERMTPRQRERWVVRPGITGLAQTQGGTSISWPERIELDLQYIQTYTFWLDLRIIAETCLSVLIGRADTHPAGDDEWSAAA